MTKTYNANIHSIPAQPRSKARRGRGSTVVTGTSQPSQQSPASSEFIRTTFGAGASSVDKLKASLGIVAKDFIIEKDGSFSAMMSDNVDVLPQKIFEITNVGTQSSPVYAVHFLLGLYSDSFISSGGVMASSGGGSAGGSLMNLSDVTILTPANGQALIYDGTTHKWKNASLPTPDLSSYATTASLNAYLPRSAGRNAHLSGRLYADEGIAVANNKTLFMGYNGNWYETMMLDGNHDFRIGMGTAAAEFNTFIEGNNIFLRTGTQHTLAVTIDAGQGVTLEKNLCLKSGFKLYLNNAKTIYLEVTATGLHLAGAGFYADDFITAGDLGEGEE